MSTKIYVKNVPLERTEAELRRVFSEAGAVVSIAFPTNFRTKERLTDAIIEFDSKESAVKAYFRFNGDFFGPQAAEIGFLESDLRDGAERGLLDGWFRAKHIRHFT